MSLKMNILSIFTVGLIVCVAMVIMTTWTTTLTAVNENHTIEELAPNVTLELIAIQELHSHIDDDKDGQVDYKESEEFVREELHQTQSQSGDKSETFHREEKLVSIDELWNIWTTSKVHNWTCDEVINWLVGVVDLPDLVPLFRKYHITGRFLPLIATNLDQFLNHLDIKGHQRSKLQIKAMDVVLFGLPPSLDNSWKDIVVTMSVIVCIIGLTYAWKKQHSARSKIDKFLEEIRIYERELNNLKSKLNGAQDSTDGDREVVNSEDSTVTHPLKSSPSNEVVEEDSTGPRCFSCNDIEMGHENEALRMKIWALESQLESSSTIDLLSLKELLLESCQSEWSYLEVCRKSAEDEVISAQKVCDKIKRRRSSVIGAFRLANSSTLEDAGLQITKAINKMQGITENFQKYHTRWNRIEQVCNFSLSVSNRTLHLHNSESRRDKSFSYHPHSQIWRSDGLYSQTDIEGKSSFQPNPIRKCPSAPHSLYNKNGNHTVDILDEEVPLLMGVASDITNDSRQWQIGSRSSIDTLEMIKEESSHSSGNGLDPDLHQAGFQSDSDSDQQDKKHFYLNGFKTRKSWKITQI